MDDDTDELPAPPPFPEPASARQNLRLFIRDENKKLIEQMRRLEERISNLEKMIG